jgi:dTMP kinase
MWIAIEGIDGAGKRTQATLLKERLESRALRAEMTSFPRYGQTVFARSVADYLNGRFGALHDIDPHLPALLYAGDRAESREYVRSLSCASDVLILDRYIASNIAYQGARIHPDCRQEFITWLAEIEYDAYQLPAADLTLLLDVPVGVSAKLVAGKGERDYTTRKADIHEADLAYLADVRRVYASLAAEQFRGPWVTVPCIAESGRMLDVHEIHTAIWQHVDRALAEQPSLSR